MGIAGAAALINSSAFAFIVGFFLLLGVRPAWVVLFRMRDTGAPRCAWCRYDRSGCDVEARCPECGRTPAEARSELPPVDTVARVRAWAVSAAMAVLFAGVVLLGGVVFGWSFLSASLIAVVLSMVSLAGVVWVTAEVRRRLRASGRAVVRLRMVMIWPVGMGLATGLAGMLASRYTTEPWLVAMAQGLVFGFVAAQLGAWIGVETMHRTPRRPRQSD